MTEEHLSDKALIEKAAKVTNLPFRICKTLMKDGWTLRVIGQDNDPIMYWSKEG